MNFRRKRLLGIGLILFALLAFVAALGACGEESNGGSENLLSNANTGNDGNDTNNDTGNANNNDVDPCAGVECSETEVCVEGDCEPIVDPGFGCHEPEDLGELSADQSFEVTADATGQPNVVQTTEDCGSDHEDSPQAVFSFSVDQPMQVDIGIEAHTDPLVIEVRQGACRDSEASLGCDNAFEQTYYPEPGITYYVIVEPVNGWNLGEFTLSFETEGLVCAPPGGWSCDGEMRVQCHAGTSEVEYECGAQCVDDECLGEGCHNAIEVTASITVEGDLPAYESSGRFDFSDSPECATSGPTAPKTDGQDLVFYLPDLKEGQVVIVDATDSPTVNVIGILAECDEVDTQCVAGNDTDQILEWTVTDDGDYYAVVNLPSADDGRFNYSVEILE